MKRLLSLLLVIAMLFSVCAVFTACDSTSVSDEDDDDDKKKEEEKEVEPTLVFRGLKVVLPADFETDDYEEGSNYVELENETYGVNIMGDPLTGEMEGLSAKELRDYYVEMLNLNGEDNGVGEFDSGKKNGTPYLYAVNEDGTNALVMAFYVDDNYGWLVQIRPLNTDEEAEFNIDDMIKLITGWKCKAPDLEEEEEDEGDEGGEVPQPPIAETNPEAEEVAGEIVYNANDVVIRWVGMYDDGYYTTIELYVENNRDHAIELYGEDFILNYTATFPANLFCYLGAGESSVYYINLYHSDLELFGAAVVGSLEFTVYLTNATDYQVLDETSRVSIKTENDGYYNDTSYGNGSTLFDENNVRVNVHSLQLNGEYYSYLWLYIENYSDQTLTVAAEEFYAMGWFLSSASCYVSVASGTYTIVGIDMSELYKLGITQPIDLKNFSCYIYCLDEEYNMLCGSDASYTPGDPNAVYEYVPTGTTLYSGEGLEVILTDIVETEYSVEFTVYFYNSWTDNIRVNLDAAKINGHDTDSGMGIALRSGMRHMGTLRLWYDENYDFTCLEDLTSLFLDLEAHDNGYYELVHQQVEIPLG